MFIVIIFLLYPFLSQLKQKKTKKTSEEPQRTKARALPHFGPNLYFWKKHRQSFLCCYRHYYNNKASFSFFITSSCLFAYFVIRTVVTTVATKPRTLRTFCRIEKPFCSTEDASANVLISFPLQKPKQTISMLKQNQ